MPSGLIDDLAHDLLDSIVAQMTAEGVTLPTRQYVWFGAVAADCEEVVVAYEQSFQGLPAMASPLALTCAVLRTVQFAIYVIRCVPVSDGAMRPPTAADQDAAASVALIDAHTLMTSAIKGYREGDFAQRCDSFGITGLTAVGPSGGFGGIALRVQVQV